MTPTTDGTPPRPDWRDDPLIQSNHQAQLAVCGDAAPDPYYLRFAMRDGQPVVYGRCLCGSWAELDDDQLHGRVSTHHDVPECGWHETVNWYKEYTAP